MNKYSVSYNVFDGVELLEDSINQIRSVVDHISIVFQETSNWGNKLTQKEIDIVYDLKNRNIIDDLFIYRFNNNISIQHNETSKRNIGVQIARDNNCTHCMTVDCDEFYVTSEFQLLINYHKENPESVSYLPLVAYYKDTKYLIDSTSYEDADLHVSGFFPIKYNLVFNYPLNLLVDPTRKVGVDISYITIFKKNQIKMHHLSHVRANLFQKINNSTSKLRYGNKYEHFNKMVECYNNFERDKVGLSVDNKPYNIIEIEPEIQLNKYYEIINIK